MKAFFGFDREIPDEMERLKIPGAALALIERGEISAIRTYGLADRQIGRAMKQDTRFSLQSISKALAAWGVMALVEDQRLDLDRPVDDYLVRWRLPESSLDRRLVTARRLLSHHAGISTSGFPGITAAFPDITLIDGLIGNLPPLIDEQAAYWKRWELDTDWPARLAYPPGEGWHYSNAGFGILELMVEDITGANFAQFMEDRILRPLGLTQSCYLPGDDVDVATPYGEDGSTRTRLRYLSHAAAGLYATIGDLAAFALSEMRIGGAPGRSVVSERSLSMMFTPHGLADRTPEVQFETGLGHLLLSRNGAFNVHHSGGSIGWRSIYSIFPDLGAGFCMLINSDGGNELWQPIIRRWRNHIFEL
ncbi:MAG: serine hydrolase domain-containing protein [Hyphomonadaceae bacterium]